VGAHPQRGNMKLTIPERLIILGLLPNKSNYVDMVVIQEFRTELGFNEKELSETGLTLKDGKFIWNKDTNKEIKISEKRKEIIEKSIKKLDKQEAITPEMVGVIKKLKINMTKDE